MDKITKNLLAQIAGLHEIPTGAVSFRKNGKGEVVRSTENIEIKKKKNSQGIDVFVRSTCKGEACHIPVVVSENNFFDLVYNDFYIEEGADVVIVAGCGIHSNGESGHDGIHCFHVGKNAKVTYIENHLALGNGKNKTLNPTTKIEIEKGGTMIKKIGVAARKDMESLLGNKIYLTTFVKVEEDWRNSIHHLKEYGYNSKD